MAPSLHLAVAQFRAKKADYRANLAHLGELFAQIDALAPRPQVLALPETALTGYFLEGGVREEAMTAGALVHDLDATYRAATRRSAPLDVTLGFYEIWNNRLYNSALYVTLGGGEPVVRHVHRKMFLPTYGMFDEERFVERGLEVRAFDTSWGRAAMLVCEDAWHSMTSTIAALDGAQVVFVCSAPPARGPWPKEDEVPGPASVSRWERLIRDAADEHGVYMTLSNLVGSEGGKLFAGSALVVGPKGDVRARGPLWEEAVVSCTVDMSDMTRARADMPLVADLEVMAPHLATSLDAVRRREPATLRYDRSSCGHLQERATPAQPAAAIARAPDRDGNASADGAFAIVRAEERAPAAPAPLTIDGPLTVRWLEQFLREEFAQRDLPTAVIGLSGGVDSAVTAHLAARALGREHVIAVRMPYRTSSPASLEHAALVADSLGIRCETVDISPAVDGYLQSQPDAEPGRRGNVMARLRMTVLFDLAAKHRGIPVGTGNKTERLFGYFTWHADDSPPINPLGDLFKTQVLALARTLGVPDAIVNKPPSADLIVGQTDEGDFGISYARADELLNWLVAGFTARDLIARGFDRAEVELVRKRVEGTHWKRRLPTVAMVSPSAIGESYLRPVDY